jgi:hypothetical protein
MTLWLVIRGPRGSIEHRHVWVHRRGECETSSLGDKHGTILLQVPPDESDLIGTGRPTSFGTVAAERSLGRHERIGVRELRAEGAGFGDP